MEDIKLVFTGDVSLNGRYDDLLREKGCEYPFRQVRALFSDADLTIGNMESPLVASVKDPAFPMKTPLKADANWAEGLKRSGFSMMNLSNNHILDYGAEGIEQTLSALTRQGIRCFGYGNNLDEAKQMVVVEIKDRRIGFVAYTDVVIESPFFAKSDTPGVAELSSIDISTETRRNKSSVDLLVVNLHWGVEYFNYPSPVQRTIVRQFINSGADIIIGHHPHVLQGIERLGNSVVAYSLGNFIFSDIQWEWTNEAGERKTTWYKFKKRNRESIVMQFLVKPDLRIDFSYKGIYLHKNGIVRMPHESAERRVAKLSNDLRSENYTELFEKKFRNFQKCLLIRTNLNRLRRLYNIKPKHMMELKEIAKQWVTLK